MNGRASSWQSLRTLLMCPPQGPQAPRNLELLTSRVVSKALVLERHRWKESHGMQSLDFFPPHFSKDLREVSLADNVEPVQGEAGIPAPHENATAQQIMQLLREIQNPQERPGLGSNPCIPFFYRADENDEVKIMVV